MGDVIIDELMRNGGDLVWRDDVLFVLLIDVESWWWVVESYL